MSVRLVSWLPGCEKTVNGILLRSRYRVSCNRLKRGWEGVGHVSKLCVLQATGNGQMNKGREGVGHVSKPVSYTHLTLPTRRTV